MHSLSHCSAGHYVLDGHFTMSRLANAGLMSVPCIHYVPGKITSAKARRGYVRIS